MIPIECSSQLKAIEMSKKSGRGGKKEVVYVVTNLHYRNNDTGHNSASVSGVFRTKPDAVAFLNKTFMECLSGYEGRGRPIETHSYEDCRVVSEQAKYEANTDQFNIECHEINEFQQSNECFCSVS